MKRVLCLVAVLALMLAACGGDDAPADTADLSTVELVDALKVAGLPIGEYVDFTSSTDPNELLGRPGQYIGKLTFHDTRLEARDDPSIEAGGSIELFGTDDQAETRYVYVATVTASLPMFTEYIYRNGPVVLRLGKALTPEQAAEYEAAFMALEF